MEHVQDLPFEGHPPLLVIKSPWEAPYGLSARELHVLNGLAQRASNQRIASERLISVRTVTTHVERILVKLGQEARAGAAAKATRGRIPASRSDGHASGVAGAEVLRRPSLISGAVAGGLFVRAGLLLNRRSTNGK